MKDLKELFESVFFAQDNRTITLSLEAAAHEVEEGKTVYDIMEKMKTVLNSIGVDNISFNPDALKVTIVTSEELMDEVSKIAKDFGAVVV